MGRGLLVRIPVGSISYFVQGMAIVCGTGPFIHRLQLGRHQRHWVVPWRQLAYSGSLTLFCQVHSFDSSGRLAPSWV